MARYRKLDTRTWSDEKFRRLSNPKPCGQVLWLYLLAGRETGIIPGVICAGSGALSESLEWKVEAFNEAFREISSQGMAEADFSARLLWIPNAIKYNKPESPNVIRSWRDAWDEAPECALKVKIWQQLKASCEGFGEAFAKAFTEACPKPFAKAMANQEQEQEQEQERARGAIAPSLPRCKRAVQLPEKFQPQQSHAELAAELGVDLSQAFQKFCDHHIAKGSTFKDWNRALSEWLRREPDFRGWKGSNGNRAEQRRNSNLAALDEAKRRMGA